MLTAITWMSTSGLMGIFSQMHVEGVDEPIYKSQTWVSIIGVHDRTHDDRLHT